MKGTWVCADCTEVISEPWRQVEVRWSLRSRDGRTRVAERTLARVCKECGLRRAEAIDGKVGDQGSLL